MESNFQALPVGYVHATDFANRYQLAGLGGGLYNCQFRVFDDGQTYTFREGDFILGGIVYMFDYPNYGYTLSEAIEDTEAYEDHMWFGPAGGELLEQDIRRTGYRQLYRPDWGLTLYQNRGYVVQLAPGEYTSYWETTYYGELVATGTVHIIVLPRANASSDDQ